MKPDRDCVRCRELLPFYVVGRLTEEERAFVTRHLATCADCTAEHAQWLTIAETVRASEPAAVPARAFNVARAQLRDRIAAMPQRNHQGDTMILSDDAPILTVPAPARRRPSAYQRAFPFAAVVLLVALAGALFFTLAHRPVPATTHPIPCPAGHAITTDLGTYDSIESFSMVNTTEGWGVGSTWGPKIDDGPYALFAHFDGCRWHAVDRSIPNVTLSSVSMSSATEGWATGTTIKTSQQGTFIPGGTVVVRYHAGKWTRVTIPGLEQYGVVTPQVKMVSDSEGWLITGSVTGDGHHVQALLYHFQHGAWTKMDVGLPPDVLLSSLTAISPDEAWMVTQKINQVDQNGTPLSYAPESIGHYQRGTWTTFDLPQQTLLKSLSMLTPTNGVALGEIGQQFYQLHFDGTTWQRTFAPLTGAPTYFDVNSLSMVSSAEGWATINDATNSQGTIIHYHGGQWTADTIQGQHWDVRTIQMLSSTDGWVVCGSKVDIVDKNGKVLIPLDKGRLFHYGAGVWSSIPHTP